MKDKEYELEIEQLKAENELLKAELASMVKRKWLDEISQFLQNNGYEKASKAIDCKYDL